MGYRFCFGPSGSGKSHKLIEAVVRKAGQDLKSYAEGASPAFGSYMYIVPEQYTMQTQKDLVMASPSHGIMNVDVLSFGRLAHRIFEEVGADGRTVLDDVGKSLILKKLAMRSRKNLTVLGGQIDRIGMISEIKSMISEFMQYDIDVEGVRHLAAYAKENGQGALSGKLSDLAVLYEAFLQYEEGRFLTGEERLDLLSRVIPESKLVRSSVLVFDGFTGFTPVQYRVLTALMQNAKEVIFSITIGDDGGPAPSACEPDPGMVLQGRGYLHPDPQDLFYLSRKTINDICVAAAGAGVLHQEDIYIGCREVEEAASGMDSGRTGRAGNGRGEHRNRTVLETEVPARFRNAPQLAHLERHLFRYPLESYADAASEEGGTERKTADSPSDPGLRVNPSVQDDAVVLAAATAPEAEVRQTFIRIRELVRSHGYAYRDFAIVTSDLNAYADDIARLAQLYDVPVYIDQTHAVLQNPLTEAICSVLEIAGNDYSYETVFRYLRSGLSMLLPEETDALENYCLAHGIASKKKWSLPFADEQVEAARQKFLQEIAPLEKTAAGTADRNMSGTDRCKALYAYLVGVHAQEQTLALAKQFEADGDTARQQEYEQIYPAVITLLDQICALLGDEAMPAGDFLELIQAGFQEIRLGTLPQQVDRVLAGDIERSRLAQVKVLFFLGVNDGAIPRNTAKGGLVSDLDREFLEGARSELHLELAPTPREQMYIQRLYLYLNMTKETDLLVLSYTKLSGDGSSIRPSYLIETIRTLFPQIRIRTPELDASPAQSLEGPKDLAGYLAGALRGYAEGASAEDAKTLLGIYDFCMQESPDLRRMALRLKDAAFCRYDPRKISGRTAELLYGRSIHGYVSRLETAVQCYLKQFLQYGLGLQRRKEYTFEPKDSGTILHDSIASFSHKLGEQHLDWLTFTAEEAGPLMDEALAEESAKDPELSLYATSRSRAIVDRMRRVLYRTIDTLQYQLQQGSFRPVAYEKQFGGSGEYRFALSDGKELILTGRIDRVDQCVHDGRNWIKIIDYKSGSLDLKEDDIRSGLRLQLMVYMDAELTYQRSMHPDEEARPAALLYYHFDDPVLSGKELPAQVAEAAAVYGQTGTREQVQALPAGEAGSSTATTAPETHAEGPGGEHIQAEQKRTEQVAVRQQARAAIRRDLRPRGMVNSDEEAVKLLDGSFSGKSDVIPVTRTKSGISPRGTFDAEEYQRLSDEVRKIVIQVADNIMKGWIDANPVKLGNGRTACTFCDYRTACGFDLKTPGCVYRDPEPLAEAEQTNQRREN